MREQAQISAMVADEGAFHRFTEVARHDLQRRRIGSLEVRQHLVDGAVDPRRIQRRLERARQRRDAGGGIVLIVGKIAVGAQVERILVDIGTEQERRIGPHAVPDAELVEHVCVVDRDVGDDEVGAHQKPEHVLADVPLLDDFRRGAARDADLSQRRLDQRFVDVVEIHSSFRAERPNDESAGHGVGDLIRSGVRSGGRAVMSWRVRGR